MEENIYPINSKSFKQKPDFTFEELEWLDAIFDKLSIRDRTTISGSFTRDEVEKTLRVLLEPEFTHNDFMQTRESLSVKIIADFFLRRAMLGHIINSTLVN